MRYYPPRATNPMHWHHKNGSTRAWRKVRANVLTRDQHTCQNCGDPATHVDHILAGGSDEPWNLQALCARCNNAKG